MTDRHELPIRQVLKILRESGGMNQDQFGAFVGVSRARICAMERGKKPVSLATLAKIAKATRIPVWRIVRKAESLNVNRSNARNV